MAKAKKISETNASGSSDVAYTVVTEFRDIDNFHSVNHVGSDVSHFDKARLDRLVELGYVEKTGGEGAKESGTKESGTEE